MLIRPELQALRSDDAPQRLAQDRMHAVLQHWRSGEAATAAQWELRELSLGAELARLPLLASLMAEGSAAAGFAEEVISPFITELARNPIGQSPLRHYSDPVLTTLTVLRHGTANLSLMAIDGMGLARRAAAESASFAPCETWEHVLSGEAEALGATIVAEDEGKADLALRIRAIHAGQVAYRFGPRETLIYRQVTGILVVLKLQRRVAGGGITREYALEDGRLLHQAAGNPRDSRHEFGAALLGRMGRCDAAPLLAAMAEEEGTASLRWQVLRECLSLDTATGFAALCRIAGRDGDPLSGPAGALRAQLAAKHPELAKVESCPA